MGTYSSKGDIGSLYKSSDKTSDNTIPEDGDEGNFSRKDKKRAAGTITVNGDGATITGQLGKLEIVITFRNWDTFKGKKTLPAARTAWRKDTKDYYEAINVSRRIGPPPVRSITYEMYRPESKSNREYIKTNLQQLGSFFFSEFEETGINYFEYSKKIKANVWFQVLMELQIGDKIVDTATVVGGKLRL